MSQLDVKKIASLARVGLTDEEISRAARDLANIFDHFSVIQKIDTKGVPTSDDITGLSNVTRADKAVPEDLCNTSSLLEAAPEVKAQQVKVKAVFD
jgi:aspartyl-tRNA(Asn)/glutamyl-tRNA(Gln) amidotransferase subunit C